MALSDAVARVPAISLVDPVVEPVARLVRRNKVLHLHLLELARAKEEVAGCDLVTERLADLRDTERRLAARELEHVLEVDEDPLGRLGTEVRGRSGFLDRAERRRQHQVELARLGQVTVGRLARMLARLAAALGILELVGSEAELARPAVHEWV